MIWFQRKQARQALHLAVVLVGVLAFALVSASTAFAQPQTPPSALNPKGINSAEIAALFNTVLIIAAVVFVIVEGLLVFSAFRFRKSKKDVSEPKQIHGNTRLEIAWTILPALIVVSLFVMALQTQQKLATKPGDAITVKVIGHQWWWEFQYPDYNITTATDLVIPAGETVNLEITSNDVIHSFWVPQLNGKTDAFPNHINTSWIKADQPGTFLGQCAELCGPSHANMRLVVIAKDRAGFDQWVKEQQAPPVEVTGDAAQGQQVFLTGACIGCHTINGTAANGQVGPNLTHFGSRTGIGGDTLPNTPGNLKRWLANPPGIKPGSIMPNLNLSSSDVDLLTAYLEALK